MIKDGELKENKSRCVSCGRLAAIITENNIPFCKSCSDNMSEAMERAIKDNAERVVDDKELMKGENE